jgi:protein-S-isoprenylcysteine O-methyltransferase Ste14
MPELLRYLLIAFILLFYLFFFIRSFSLSKSLRKNIKARNAMLHISILFAGLSSALFLIYLIFPKVKPCLFIPYTSSILIISGTIMIFFGLITSSVASLTLKNSWRIGVNENEKTDLITSGIFGFSRNPYFLSYDLVLLGMVFCLPSPFLFIPVLITAMLFHKLILKEEEYLERQHGTAYLKYKGKVRRYL